MSEMQTRNSAPQDGSHILAFVLTKKHRCWMVIRWLRGQWVTVPGDYGCEALYWMPLPPHPYDLGNLDSLKMRANERPRDD